MTAQRRDGVVMKAELLVPCKNALGEGVQWNGDHQRVWWTDIDGYALWSCDADGGGVEKIKTPERLGSFAFDPDNNILAAFQSGLFRWSLEADRLERLTYFEPDLPMTRYNDGRCDRQGRFVVGGINEDERKPISTLTRYDGSIETLLTGIGVSNSICFSPDGRWMYFSDTPTKVVHRFAYDTETGALGPAEVFATAGGGRRGFPDGACVDAEGAVWSTRFWGGHVQRVMADGSEDMRIDVDAPQVSCACFGGPDLERMFITTAQEELPAKMAAAAPLSGGLFVAEPGVKGLPETRYAQRLF
ncbi:MAG: SMP-30/gluconolactonase/LRE family protein [Pikeienuella sp.]